MKRFSFPRAVKLTALLLCVVLLAGCSGTLTKRELLSAALGPTVTTLFPNSTSQVQTDTGGAALPCYYDSASGIYYYVCEDLNKVSTKEYAYTLRTFYFLNGTVRTRTLATRTVLYNDSGQAFTSCRDFSGNVITETDYMSYADRYFSGYTRTSVALEGSAAMPSAPTPVPAPIPTPAATPYPTPAPTPTPSQTNYSGPAPVITKNPTSESLAIGGTTWFIAHASNANNLTWQGVSPDGLVYTTKEMLSIHPGLVLETEKNDTLAVRNVPASLNCWGFQARFEGTGGVAVSSAAFIYVGDFISSYQTVLNAYRAAYQVGGHTAQYASANGLSTMIAHSAHVGYAFKDLDKDGTPELFIAGINPDDTARSVVYDVYTLVNGAPKRLVVSAEQDRYYLCTDSAIFNSGSEDSAHSYYLVYHFSNNRIRAVEGYLSCFTGGAKDGYYYHQGDYSPEPQEGDVPLTESAFNSRVRERQNTVFQLLYTQLA